jgi:hypothetical protein
MPERVRELLQRRAGAALREPDLSTAADAGANQE